MHAGNLIVLDKAEKKKSCLVVLHRPPLIFENRKKVFTVQKYTAPNFQNSKKSFFFFENFDILKIFFKGQRYVASVCHIISLIEFRKPFTQSKCINCIGIQNNNILKKLFHTFIQTVILKLVMLNYG